MFEKLEKLEDMKRQLHGDLHGWLSQLRQQQAALVTCFGLGDVDTLIRNMASEPSAGIAVISTLSSAAQTASIDTFIKLMLSSSIVSSPPASGPPAYMSISECVKISRQLLIYAAIGCRSVLARETAATAQSPGASVGMRADIESEISVLKQQMQEQLQQSILHEEQLLVTTKTNQVTG